MPNPIKLSEQNKLIYTCGFFAILSVCFSIANTWSHLSLVITSLLCVILYYFFLNTSFTKKYWYTLINQISFALTLSSLFVLFALNESISNNTIIVFELIAINSLILFLATSKFHLGTKDDHVLIILGYFFIVFGTLIRIIDINYIDSVDNFTTLSIKNLFENGTSYYKDAHLSTYISLLSANLLNELNSLTLRLPSIIFSSISILLLFTFLKKISLKAATFTVILFAISPWSIALSRIIRNYAFDGLITVIVLILSSKILFSTLSTKKKFLYLTILTAIVIGIAIINNRHQSAIAALLPCLTIFYILITTHYNSYSLKVNYLLKIAIILASVVTFYFASASNFKSGLQFNITYLNQFFNPNVQAPWQWFNEQWVSMTFIVTLFLIPFFFIKNELHKKHIHYFYFLFLGGLALFVFKFVPHADDFPSRYVYFLFSLYCIILGFAFSTLCSIKGSYKKYMLIFFICLNFFNLIAIQKAVLPSMQIEQEIMITPDSIGISRPNMYPVVSYINELVDVSNTTFVFAGRYAEFVTLLDLDMNGNRSLQGINCDVCSNRYTYDVSTNTFVESYYWNIHELSKALNSSETGLFITEDKCISDQARSYLNSESVECIISLNNNDFIYNDTVLTFIKNINGYRIFYWDKSKDSSKSIYES